MKVTVNNRTSGPETFQIAREGNRISIQGPTGFPHLGDRYTIEMRPDQIDVSLERQQEHYEIRRDGKDIVARPASGCWKATRDIRFERVPDSIEVFQQVGIAIASSLTGVPIPYLPEM